MKIAIIGGGPIGIEAALYGAFAGLDVQLFERGRVGDNVRRWNHVRLFTEWKRDRSPLAARLLRERGDVLPPDEESPSGEQLADFLLRLASLPVLRGKIAAQTEVVSISRDGLLKSDFFVDERRTSKPFRILTRGIAGEQTRFFDAILDCTGVYTSPNHVGIGGALCAGEAGLARAIDYAIPDVLGADRARFANKHALVVGSGHSAASTLLAISDLFARNSRTRLTWIVRRDRADDGSIYVLDPNDVSGGRRQLGERANALVVDERVDLRVRTQVESIKREAGRFQVQLSDGALIECDTVCAHTGFRADPKLWEELQIAQHPATGGPGRLADAILQANARAGVGLSTGYAEKRADIEKPEANEKVDARSLLRLDEPNFFVLGIKSYGRDAGFLMQNGHRQIRDAFALLTGNDRLDLYGEF